MDLSCPHCGTEYEFESHEIGSNAVCQKCGETFLVVSGAESPAKKVAFGVSTLSGNYVCTYCGEVTASPQVLNGTLIGCASLCAIPVALLSSLIFTPIVGILLALFFLVGGIVGLSKRQSVFCPKCQRRNTLISTTSPQGIRLLKETAQNNAQQSPQPVASQGEASERLNKLKRLLDERLIDETEYNDQRKRIINDI